MHFNAFFIFYDITSIPRNQQQRLSLQMATIFIEETIVGIVAYELENKM
jgi:hypothetical protein